MANVVELSERNFDQEVLQSELPVLVDFWAPWCGPCRMVGPIIEELAGDYQGRLKVCKLNVDQEQALAGHYQVMSIPTVLIFRGGQVAERSVGAKPKPSFQKIIDGVL